MSAPPPGAPQDLAPARVHALLRTQRVGRSLRVLAETDSTNDDARSDAANGCADGHVVVADAQRQGRGSHGRAWASPPGTDLYLSIVVRPELPLALLGPMTLAVGLGVAEAVDAVLAHDGSAQASTLAPARVKWPNDVWLDGKKCAGILVEARSPSAHPELVVGIGMNVNRLELPDAIAASATSLRLSRGQDAGAFDRARVLAELLLGVERWIDRFVSSSGGDGDGGQAVADALQARLALAGERVRCDGREGTVIGVASSGALRLSTGSGVVELIAGRIERAS